MLQQMCEYIHNYFVRERYAGTYTIADGAFSPALSLKEGQRFLVAGSDLNDGIYTYHSDGITNDDDTERAGLADEVFAGAICGLAVPPQLVSLSAEINSWVEKFGETMTSPYQSESFGGYSYTKAASGGASDAPAGSWQQVFGSRMNRWRKVSF